MSSYTIADAKNDLTGMSHGGSLGKIRNLDALWWRAARNLITRINPQETRRITNITNAIHDDIYDYALPSDFKDIIDLRPQVGRLPKDNITKIKSERFDLYKAREDGMVQIKDNNGTKSIRINIDISPSPITLHEFNSLTGNGTVAVVGTASNLGIDGQYFVSGSKSVKFDVAATGDGIKVTGMTTINLSDHDEISEHFIRVYLEDVTNINSITPVWGNDLSLNFWTGVAQTAQADGTAFRVGWNIIRIQWNAATETGTVTPSEIDSLQVTFDVDAAISNVRVDLWTSSLGEIWEIEYYSKYLFRSSAGVFLKQPTATDDSDIINLDEDGYNIFIDEVAYLASQQTQGEDAVFDRNFLFAELYGEANKRGLYDLYTAKHPNEAMKEQGRYYNFTRPRQSSGASRF